MPDYNSKNIRYPSQLAIFIGLTGGGLVIGTLASFAIWTMMTGQPFPLNADEMLQPKYFNVNMVLQGALTFFIFFVPVHFFALICYRKPFKYLGFHFHFNFKQFLLAIGILILAILLIAPIAYLNKIIPISKELKHQFVLMLIQN